MKKTILYLLLICFSIGLLTNCQSKIYEPKQKFNDGNLKDFATTEIVIQSATWMNNILNKYQDKSISLINICLPRAHDAGMYELQLCTFGANACNTQTQALNMAQMLSAGIRAFDLRPVLFNDKYYVQHATACDGLGCKGDLMKNILQQTKDYLDNHAELVIFELGHFCGTNANDVQLINMINTILGDRIFKDSSDNSVNFINRNLISIIPNHKKGKVVITYDGVSNNLENRQQGIFANSYVGRNGLWSNVQWYKKLKTSQLAFFQNQSHNGNSLAEISWTLTMNSLHAVFCTATLEESRSIKQMAHSVNKKLAGDLDEWITDGTIKKNKIPNIISVDYAKEFVTMECIKITELNLAE